MYGITFVFISNRNRNKIIQINYTTHHWDGSYTEQKHIKTPSMGVCIANAPNKATYTIPHGKNPLSKPIVNNDL